MSAFKITSGSCFACFAYDLGSGVNLNEAKNQLGTLIESETIRQKRRAPRYFEFRPYPLKLTVPTQEIPIGKYKLSPQAELTIFDFGAVSVTYTIPIEGSLDDLVDLSDRLYDLQHLFDDSRRLVTELAKNISSAVTKPNVAKMEEPYGIFQIRSYESTMSLHDISTELSLDFARILRSEKSGLSKQEIADATNCSIAYGLNDILFIDWDNALVIAEEADDIRAVLEYANVALLELRFLDDQLDIAMDSVYDILTKQGRQRRFSRTAISLKEQRRIGQLQVDSALFYESVNNALKLLGDQYLARVYRLISKRFHLARWDLTVRRKLQTLDSIYEKLGQDRANWRLELLEWIIIGLIAISILLPFLPGMKH